MQYQFYIYKSRYYDRSFNAAVRSPALRERLSEEDYEDFDVEKVKEEIEGKMENKCHVTICFPILDCDTVRCLYVTTSFEEMQEVVLCLHTITERNRLTLYDAEREKTFYHTLIDDSFLNRKKRIQEFKEAILREVAPVWSIHRLYALEFEEWASEYAYVVTLKKTKGVSLLKRTADFHACLQRHLAEGETLSCEDQSFTIRLRGGYVTFCLEGYKKDPDRMGFVEDGQPRIKLLHRMGCEKAFQVLKQHQGSGRYDVEARMHLREMLNDYPNPADRYVCSVNIMKWLNQQPFSVDYSGIWFTRSYFLFHPVAHWSMPEEKMELSALKIEESSVSFILPIIQEFCPYIYDHYYSSNHISEETLKQIVERLKQVEFLIKTDPFSLELKPYSKEFNLYVLQKNEEDWKNIRENPAAFLSDHRYEVAIIYQIVIEWAEKQLETYRGCDRLYNIEGP